MIEAQLWKTENCLLKRDCASPSCIIITSGSISCVAVGVDTVGVGVFNNKR